MASPATTQCSTFAVEPGQAPALTNVIKNKEIFEKAQRRDKPVDWYEKLQESKEAFFRVDVHRYAEN